MIFDSLGATLIYVILTRGNISKIENIEIKKPLFFIIGFALEFGVLNLSGKFPIIMSYRLYIYFLDYLMLFIGLWYNRHNKYMIIISIGIFLNFLVIFANGGKMPVSISALKFAGLDYLIPSLTNNSVLTHQVLTSTTRLKFLSDVLALPRPYPLPKTFSIGDLFIASGIFLLLTKAMSNKKKEVKA